MAEFSRARWPDGGPVREFLSYLERMHTAAGQPSLTEISAHVHLAPSTIHPFFAGTRLISAGNLELLHEFLGGDLAEAERLRRAAVPAWRALQAGRSHTGRSAAPESTEDGPAVRAGWTVLSDPDSDDASARLEVVIFHTAANTLNRPERLVGREDLLARIGPWLDAGERVLLHGLGGSGKTALAATVADRRLQAGDGSYLWLRTGNADAEVVLDGLARSLASRAAATTTGDARLLAVRDAVAATGVRLCVIDDVWSAAAAHTILRALPTGVGVLVTSRLKLAADHQVEVADLAPAEAVRLLAIHARDDAYAWQPDAEALCEDLGFHPYAIEIAGRHLHQYGLRPAELREHIAGAPHELEMPAGSAPDERQSVRRLLDRTAELLRTDHARDALAAFGAFFSGTLSVELLGTYLHIGNAQARTALGALVDVSLAKRAPGSAVYEIHDLTLSYARAANTHLGAARKAAVAALRDLGTAHVSNLDLLGAELDNLLAGAELALDTAPDDFLSIIETLAVGGYLDEHGHTMAMLRLLDEAIELVRATGPPERLHLLLGKRGNASFNAGDLAGAAVWYDEALALAPTPQRRVVLLSVLGKVLGEMGHYDEAEAHFAGAYTVAETQSDDAGTLRVLEQHSRIAHLRQDFAMMRDLTLRGVELAQRLGDRTREAILLVNLGTADYELGLRAALRRHERALAIAEEINTNHVRALANRALGLDQHSLERFDEAQRHFHEALALYRRLGQSEHERDLEAMMQRFGYLT